MSHSGPPPLREDVAEILASAQQLANWIALRQDGLVIKARDETRVPGVLLDLALEHQVGIVQLIGARVYGSAFALLRAQLEAFVRAVWLQLCATEEELKLFVAKDMLPLNFGQMIDSIEHHKDFSDKVLSSLKRNTWRAMNGYTHGGMHQIARRMKDDSIEPNYEPEEVIEVLKASGTFALMALLQIARLAGEAELEKKVNERLIGRNIPEDNQRSPQ